MTEMRGTPVGDDSSYPTVNERTAESITAAPLPTRRTLRMRQNLPIQSWRFLQLNLKVMRIVARGHR